MFLTIDTETTGIARDTALLTAYFGVFDNEFNFVNELDLRVKPNDGRYLVEPESLGINNIDLVEHNRTAITYKEGGTGLYNFLRENTTLGDAQLIPVGHNVGFDIAKITENLISKNSWDTMVSYRVLDTAVIAQFLKVVGRIPMDIEAGLGKLVKYFGVEIEGNPHEAKYDALATLKVLEYLIAEAL